MRVSKQEVNFISRYQMKKLLSKHPDKIENLAIISINDSKKEAQEMDRLLKGRCFHISCFADKDKIKFTNEFLTSNLPRVVEEMDTYNAMENESYQEINLHEAVGIIDFIDKNRDKSFLIHCFMGISRSAAVAKYADKALSISSPQLKYYDSYNSGIYQFLVSTKKALDKIR